MNIIYNRNSTISITSDILIGSGAASGHYDTYYTYDRMGNITSQTRIGLIGGTAYGIIDNLNCNYDGNRLTKVEDSAADADQPTYYGAFHFNDGADSDLEYAYDQNGNMTKDLNKDITEIKYNLMNLPAKITYSDGKSLSFTYSANGERLSVTHNMVYTGDFNAYFGPFIYRNGSLQRVLVDGGYTSGSQYHFYLTDHLGNNRVVANANGTVEQVNHYYPYGGLTGESTGGSVQPYKYNGKELERMNGLDLYDYGARWMDAALGRFTTIDPMCEKYYGISPYAYCAGNPVNLVDLDGERIYMLFYTTGNDRGDEMFKSAAETRKIDIENSKGFNKDNDIVIMSPISDLGTLCDEVSKIVNTYSDQYGKTAEFSMWSHSALDGPRGSTETSQYQIYRNQMSLEGWGRINFNWDEKASANFFGCRSGSAENGTSFSTNISALDNFKNVTVHGQVSYAYPSVYTNARQTNKNIIAEKPNYPTYFVGSERSVFWGRVMPTFTEAYPMRESMNGYGHVNRYYQPGRKTRR